jgi:TRAP-type mannitol/chloroaromatic compound transport system substrate-binding protein
MVETAARAANDEMLAEFTARNSTALRTLVEEHGVEVRRLPTTCSSLAAQRPGRWWPSQAQGNELAQRIHRSYMDFLALVRDYQAISEQAYINAR